MRCKAKKHKEKLKTERTQLKTFTQCLEEPNDYDYSGKRNFNTKTKCSSAKKIRVAISIIAALVVICGIALIVIETKPIRDYHKAVGYMEAEDYLAAIATFQECSNYKNVDELLTESKYCLAEERLQSKDFDGALALFGEIDGYRDSETQIKETKYRKAVSLKDSNDYEEAITLFSELGNYGEAKKELSELNDTIFSTAVSKYEDGKIYEAKRLFSLIPTYDGVFTYLEEILFIDSYRGTWGILVHGLLNDWVATEYYVIDGLTVYFVPNERSSAINYDISPKKYTSKLGLFNGNKCLYIESVLEDTPDKLLIIENGTLCVYVPDYDWYTQKYVYEKREHERKSDSVDPYTVCDKAPRIGMTAEEVKNSTWGEPQDINSTITAYGTREQWVYDHYRYIYLDDGIVTGIQN